MSRNPIFLALLNRNLTPWEKTDKRETDRIKAELLAEETLFENRLTTDDPKGKFSKVDYTQQILSQIGHGASLDGSNAQFLTLRDPETGENVLFLVKKLGSVDSVIFHGFFRAAAAGHCDISREIIIHDPKTNQDYSAIRFNEKILREKELDRKTLEQIEILKSQLEAAREIIIEERINKTDEPSEGEKKAEKEKYKNVTAETREAIERKIQEIKEKKERELKEKRSSKVEVEPSAEKRAARINAERYAKNILQDQYEALRELEGPLEEKNNFFLGPKNYGDRNPQGAIDALAFGDLRDLGDIFKDEADTVAKEKKQHDFLMNYAYMAGLNYVFGEADDNPENFVYAVHNGVKVPGRIDLGGDVNTHPEPFGRLMYGMEDDFPDKLKTYLTDEGSNPLPHKQYPMAPNDFLAAEDVKKTDRFRVYGCFQSAMFFLQEIAREKLDEKDKLRPNLRAGKLDMPQSNSEPRLVNGEIVAERIWNKGNLTKYAEDVRNILTSPLEGPRDAAGRPEDPNRKPALLKSIQDRINAEAALIPPSYKTRDLFIAFMHGISAAIDLSKDKTFLSSYAKKFGKTGEDNYEIAKQHVQFLRENAAEASVQFEVFLKYYKKIKRQLTEFEAPIKHVPTVTKITLDQKKIRDFKKGKRVVLEKDVLLKAEKLWNKNVSDSIEIAENVRNNSAPSVDSADKSQKPYPHFKYRVVEQIAGAPILRAIKTDFSASPLEALPTQISDISLQKAKKLPDNFEVNLPKSPKPYKASNFEENTALFSDKTQPGEIHVNFGERLNYGGRVLQGTQKKDLTYDGRAPQGIPKEDLTYDEQKTLHSSTSLALASLQQSTYNKKRRHFLDFTLGKPGAMAGRPILIKGQRFFSKGWEHPGVEIAELDMALPEADVGGNLEQEQLRQAHYFFATAYNGFKMCKGNNQQSPVIRSGVQKNHPTLSIHMQLAMQILAAQCADVQLKLTNKFLEHNDHADEFKDFKNRILPQINLQLQSNTSIKEKIAAINDFLRSPVQSSQSGQVGSVVETYLDDLPLPPAPPPSPHPASRGRDRVETLSPSPEPPLPPIPPRIHNIVPRYHLKPAASFPAQIRQEIYAEIPQVNSPPGKALIFAKAVPLITMNKEVATLHEVQDKIQQVITATVNRLSGRYPDIEQKINILMESLAQYGSEHLTDIDGKSISSILKGGEDAGFTNWRKNEDFRKLLSKKAQAKGLHDLDFSGADSKDTRFFAALSLKLQENSEGIFSTLNNKHYATGENKARTWRMAMLKNIKELAPEPPHRSR